MSESVTATSSVPTVPPPAEFDTAAADDTAGGSISATAADAAAEDTVTIAVATDDADADTEADATAAAADEAASAPPPVKKPSAAELRQAKMRAAVAARAANPYPEPSERPEQYCVVSDNMGFVGAFYTAESVAAMTTKHHSIPFLIQRYRVAPGPVATVWVVLYRDLDAVAFVTNDRAEAEKVQEMYGRIGLAYSDSIDYWEHRADTVNKAAEERLNSLSRAHAMYLGGGASAEELREAELKDYERIVKMSKPIPNGPIEQLLRENERITIFDCVVPTAVGGADCSDDNADDNADADVDSPETEIMTREEDLASEAMAAEAELVAAEPVAAADPVTAEPAAASAHGRG